MKVAIARLSHETNTFSTVHTYLRDYNPCYGEDMYEVYGGTRTEVGGFFDVMKQNRVEIIPILAASATPSGPLIQEDYEFLLERILNDLQDAAPVDGVLLSLHGAMVVQSVPEAEGTLLHRIRSCVGEEVPIVCTLDLHALVSRLMVENVNAIFGFDTNPHIDQYERGVEAAKCMVSTLNGVLTPVVTFHKLAMMPPTINMRTTEGPMVKLFQRGKEMEGMEKVINVSVFGGFPYADVERVGSSVVVVTDDDHQLATQLASELGTRFWSLRNEFLKELVPVDRAVERAQEASQGPIILADVADNPGGGAPGDGTVILQTLLERGVTDVGVGVLKDAEAVEKAIRVGVGETVTLAIGGKTDDFHGKPIVVSGLVRTITDGIFTHKAMRAGLQANVGHTVVLDVSGIEIIVSEKSHAPNDPEIFRRNGIEPFDKKILVLKSRGHFRAAYEPHAEEVIEVDAPGLTSPNLALFSYQSVPRPLWPLDDH